MLLRVRRRPTYTRTGLRRLIRFSGNLIILGLFITLYFVSLIVEMTYFRLEVTFRTGPHHVTHLLSRQSTTLLAHSDWVTKGQCRAAFRRELLVHRQRYGIESMRYFRYIMIKKYFYPESWLYWFFYFVSPADCQMLAFNDEEARQDRIAGA